MAKARLILVHGRAQVGKSEAVIIKEWMDPLRTVLGNKFACLDEVEVMAPFYGDRLVELLAAIDQPGPADIVARGGDSYGDEERYRSFLGQYLEVLRRQENISEEQLIREAGLKVIDRGPQNRFWVLAVIRALNKIPGLDGNIIERLLRDVWIYLDRPTVQRAIDAIVALAFDTNLPVVCVAHSLGTVVAYNVLRALPNCNVPQFVTLGSPLGLAICRERLSPITHPQIVGRWFNARDRHDLVALYSLDLTYFPIEPAISNCDDVQNQTTNAHGISGYMNNADVGDELYRALSLFD